MIQWFHPDGRSYADMATERYPDGPLSVLDRGRSGSRVKWYGAGRFDDRSYNFAATDFDTFLDGAVVALPPVPG